VRRARTHTTVVKERAMETQRAVQAIVIPVIAFAAVILVAVGFGMFLHIVPKGTTPLFALLGVILVMVAAGVTSSRSPSHH
jgi:hypothetical protein